MQPAKHMTVNSPSSTREDTEVYHNSSPRSRSQQMPTQTLVKPKSLCRFIVSNHFPAQYESDGRYHDAYGDDVWEHKKNYSSDRISLPRRFSDPRRSTTNDMNSSAMKDKRLEYRETPSYQCQRSQLHEYRASAAVDDTQQRRFQKLVCPPQLRPPINSTYNMRELLKLDQLQNLHDLNKLNDLKKLNELRRLNELHKLRGTMKYYPTSTTERNTINVLQNQLIQQQRDYENIVASRSPIAEKRINVSFSEDHETRATTQQKQQQHSSLPDEDDNHFDPALVLASMATQKPAMIGFKPSPPPDLFLRRPPFMPSLKPLPPQIPTSYSSSKSSYSPPVVKASEPRWICERCNTAIYSSYEEAYLHDLSCPARILRSVTSDGTSKKRPSTPSDEPDEKISKRTKTAPLENSTLSEDLKFSKIDGDRRWFSGYSVMRMPILASTEIGHLSNDLPTASSCVECIELFSIEDMKQYYQAFNLHNSNSYELISRLQVGIRCQFCKTLPYSEREIAAVLFPSTISEIRESVKLMMLTHIPVCKHVPETVHHEIRLLKNFSSWTETVSISCMDSVKELGVEETNSGLRFSRPLPPRIGSGTMNAAPHAEKRILFPQDKSNVDPYVYMLLEQVEVCYYSEADSNLARSKGPIGFPGIQCHHCHGHAGIGKYFPATPEALTLNSVSQNLYSHLMKCKWCPQETKDGINFCKEQKGLREFSRPPPGWRKDFFLTLWGRLHGN